MTGRPSRRSAKDLPLTRPFSIQSMNRLAVVFTPIGLKGLILACGARLPASSITSAHNMQTSTSTKSAFDGRNALSPAKPFADLAKAEKSCASYGRGSRLHFSCHRFSAPRSAGRCVVPPTAAEKSNRQLPLVDEDRVRSARSNREQTARCTTLDYAEQAKNEWPKPAPSETTGTIGTCRSSKLLTILPIMILDDPCCRKDKLRGSHQ